MVHMIVALLISTLVFVCFLWRVKRVQLLRSLSYTFFFIFAIWVNIPCYISAPNDSNAVLDFLFLLCKQTGLAYVLIANICVCLILCVLEHYLNPSSLSYQQLKSRYDSFVSDASELYIIGRDLDFLHREGFEEQTYRIEHLGSKAKLLCEKTSDPELHKLYSRVKEKGVRIETYQKSEDLTNLKGQIKIAQSGYKEAIFSYWIPSKDWKGNDLYHLEEINNQYLLNVIIKLYDSYFRAQSRETA